MQSSTQPWKGGQMGREGTTSTTAKTKKRRIETQEGGKGSRVEGRASKQSASTPSFSSKPSPCASPSSSPASSSSSTTTATTTSLAAKDAGGAIDVLPDELLVHIFSMLPYYSVAPASRTCKRWYGCAEGAANNLRHQLSLKWACSSIGTLQWATSQKSLPWFMESWDESTCVKAAKNGQLAALKWLVRTGCPWSRQACTKAAENGHLEVVKWIHAAGLPWELWEVNSIAHVKGHTEIIEFVTRCSPGH